ncbi:ABC transporter permease subunit [Clostridium culturomicium]|uniref:ABC transporter permease subunit n=1 Tax=Clostridium culturomicium TaxID=1499683 RepID=UPI0038574943
MLRIVKAELYKLFKNRTFRVLCGVTIVLSIMMMAMSSPFMEDVMVDSLGDISVEEKEAILSQMGAMTYEEQVVTPGKMGLNLVAKDPMNPTALEIYHSSFGAGLIEILIGILIAGFLAKEYSEGTIKNTLAYGKKRHEFYIAKFLAMIVGVAILTACLISISTIGSTIINGWGQTFELSQILGMLQSFVASIFANSAVIAIIMIFAILIKSNGGTIAITAGLFILAPMIISFFYGIYPWFDKIYELTPFYNSALATSIYVGNGDLMRSIVIAAVTIVIVLMAGIQILKAQDIK